MDYLKSITLVSLALAAASCRHTPPESVDVVSGATIPHNQIVLPPTNSHYHVRGHFEGLNNYVVKYSDTFYRGGQVYLEDIAAESLQKCGIQTIVSITPDHAEVAFCASNGFALVEIPFDKSGPTPADYELFFKTLENADGSFYVHCKSGTHRAGILSAAYRIHSEGWSLERALVEYGRLGGDLKADHEMIQTLHATKIISK
ncbi:MAG: sulfur transferase domain-containing protein [Pontiella sp.]